MNYNNQNAQYNPNMNGPQYLTYSNPKNTDYKSVPQENDIEQGGLYKEDFDLQLRLGFIRKVYGILSAQLLFTFFMCLIACSSDSFVQFQRNNIGLLFVAVILSIVIMITLMCFPAYAKKVPTNYVLLGVFTLCEAYIVSALCGHTDKRIVLMAASMTCFMTIALTVYACTTKTDFTVMGSLLFLGACILLLFSLFLMFFHSKILHLVICCFGVFLYSLYLIYDTQLIMGNKENGLDYDDYIIGALILYLDVINLFIYLLQLFRNLSGNN